MAIFKNKHELRRIKSFAFAFEGILHALFNEPNFRIQLVISICAVVAGFYYAITNLEWAVLIIILGIMLSAEMINTIVEEILDRFFPEEDAVVKIIKDLASGYVLVTAVCALLIVFLIFSPKF